MASPDSDVHIDAWGEYLTAFDDLLAARQDLTARLLARRRMVAILEADPDYWRGLAAEHARRRRAAQRRLELNREQAPRAARARWDRHRAAA